MIIRLITERDYKNVANMIVRSVSNSSFTKFYPQQSIDYIKESLNEEGVKKRASWTHFYVIEKDNNIIASDSYIEDYTSNYFYHNDGTTYVNKEYTDEQIINGYMGTIKYIFKRIGECNGDWYTFWKGMTEGSCMDREDIEYNEELWDNYKPLYDLLKNKGYELE